MVARYGPDNTWPRHQKPYWKRVMAEARLAGWTLEYLDAPHAFGTVSCPSGEHTFMVDKTARGGESASVLARKLVRRCTHRPAADAATRARQEECARLLDEAGQLIASADTGLAMAETHQDAWDDLERLEIQLRTASETTAKVLRTELHAAWSSAIASDEAPSVSEIASTLDDATSAMARGKSEAASLKLTELVSRARGYLRQVDMLRRRLAALRERARN